MKTDFKSLSMDFSKRVISKYQEICCNRNDTTLANQLLRCRTAVGALFREAMYAESRADMIHKLCIALKECNESIYWIELLHYMGKLTESECASLKSDADHYCVFL
jgi:four helix bundle protein